MKQVEEFVAAAGDDLRVFFAPGRVNLIGEHTDYSGGYVFPAALSFGTHAYVRPRTDGVFRVASTHFDLEVMFGTENLVYRAEDDWANFPKGVVRELAQRGIPLSGAEILYHGNIPNGAGLSSSASIELVTAVALAALGGVDLSRVELVLMCQKVENEFIGVQCGIMDQFAVGMGRANHAVLLNCDTLEYRYAPLELGDYQLVITHTNKRRQLLDSSYNERRTECETALAQIQAHHPEVGSLGELSAAGWREARPLLQEFPVLQRRVEHVVSENDRVLASCRALESGDLAEFGRLMIQSHESLRDLYEVTGQELDALVEAARVVDGCIGTRMTGGGFGGCTVSLVHREAIGEFQELVAARYTAQTGLTPTFYVCAIGDGAQEVKGELSTWQS
ncbi:galactokinase [Tumebacillus permanentifrigoris]|uniref:Galactokinase n=1 Tax=Tumebacillus permanentifrigoris TaxID=378543 RepID=A0A316D644_9BACL|nr:galactokinase [Tumebacillus permanentifrigoris]PWK06594.1 galactokinase [Tumebacillus permanentifrigoris]